MLKYTIRTVLVILMFCLAGADSFAQKAYEVVIYKGEITGIGNIQLDLADGYLPASMVTFGTARKSHKFSPSTAEPDSQRRLLFKPVVPGQVKEQVVIFLNPNEKGLPKKIPTEYIIGKKRYKTVLRSVE